MQDCLQLVHCHPGSQLQDIRRVKDAINELAHVYAELKLMGAGLEYIDVGGGLGVDYDGSGTNFASSMNYTLDEYASDVVYRIASVCNARGIEHPMIVSESGRAIAAHHSVLIFNVLGSSALDRFQIAADEEQAWRQRRAAAAAGAATCSTPGAPSTTAAWSSATTMRRPRATRCCRCSTSALLSLRAARPCRAALLGGLRAHPRLLPQARRRRPRNWRDLETVLSDTYFCNFSVFQSLPDSWAIDQLFPIMPIHRLDEQPLRNAVLADITCDSDGKIDRFVSPRDAKRTLELHDRCAGEDYYLAAFLVGAYQETLGDLHNLFGDTHVVHIRLHDEGGWWIEEIVKGDTANQRARVHGVRRRRAGAGAGARLRARGARGRMTVAESQALKRFYENELDGYAYLEP